MNKGVTLVAVALLSGCASGPGYVLRPPARFQGDGLAVVHFVSDVQKACLVAGAELKPVEYGNHQYVGCAKGIEVWVRNPCSIRDEAFAAEVCHEHGHVLGWPADHPP